MPTANPKEYLSLFSNAGPVKVHVRLKDVDGTITARSMAADEIVRLLADDGEGFMRYMTFDEWPLEISKYEIDPAKNTLTLHARKIQR